MECLGEVENIRNETLLKVDRKLRNNRLNEFEGNRSIDKVG